MPLLTYPIFATMRVSWTKLAVATFALLAFLGASPTIAQSGEDSCCDYPVSSGECDLHPLSSYRVTSDMLDPDYGLGQHTGEDWNRGGGDDDLGDPVCAVGDGVVVASDSYLRWSNVIVVRHDLPGGVRWSQYAHLQQRIANVGDRVVRGQMIGTIGQQFPERPCRSDGVYCAHLHFEIRRADVPPNNWPNDAVVILQQYLDPTDHARDIRPEAGFVEGNRVTVPGDSEPNPEGWTITLDGVGPILVGRSKEEAIAAAPHLLRYVEEGESQTLVVNGMPNLTFYIYDLTVVNAMIEAGSQLQTLEGIGIGSSTQDIIRAYGSSIRHNPSYYGDEAYILATPAGSPSETGTQLVFIVSNNRVRTISVRRTLYGE